MKTTLPILLLLILLCGCEKKHSGVPEKTLRAIEKDTVRIVDSVITKERKFDNLSRHFDYKLTYFEKYKGARVDRHYWDIVIYDRRGKKVDSVRQQVDVFEAAFVDLDHTRSYSTGFHKNDSVVDNYHGDFVVADLNFDGREDFAIIRDMGGTAGPFYSFYEQSQGRKFALNRFLQDSVIYFPDKINTTQKTLTTLVIGGVCWLGEHQYQLKDSKWSQVSHKVIDHCKDKK